MLTSTDSNPGAIFAFGKGSTQECIPRLPLADARQFRSDLASLAIDFVTAEARRILALDERLSSLVGVAAVETLAPLCERILRVARRFELASFSFVAAEAARRSLP